MEKFTIIYRGDSTTLTRKQFMELFFNNRIMESWGASGTYGDGDRITDQAGYKRAKRIDKKLTKLING